jgi:hypothetical protein
MNVKFLLITFILLFLFSSTALAQETIVGVSPLILDIGEIERGSSRVLDFYLISATDEKLLVKLESIKGGLDFFNKESYRNFIFNVSEENAEKWIEFLRNPVELEAPKEEIRLARGVAKGVREVNFMLNIPSDAEPGYHVVRIRPTPIKLEKPAEGGVGVGIVTTIDVSVLFKIPGDAIREGKIFDIVAGDYSGDDLEVKIFFKNTGTTTLLTRADSVKVYKDGKEVQTLSPVTDYVEPGETKSLRTWLNTRNLDLGEYDVAANVSYSNDMVSLTSKMNVYEKPEPSAVEVKPPEVYFPWWILIAIPIIVILSYIIYRRL